MEFSVWNAVTIVIVLFVLVIYRQLDSKNRSLEKVKRFSDKVMADLSALVEERSREIKDLAIDLDVNVKTGREALKRVREVEQGLNERATAIQAIEARINGYDQVLGELAGMTSRVDDNLRRIHEESEFVDRVSRSITEASSQLGRLEKRIPEIENELSRGNQAALDELRVESTRRIDEQIETLFGRAEDVNARLVDFSAYIARLESRREAGERESIERLEKAVKEQELGLRGSVEALVSRVDGHVSSAESSVVGRVQESVELARTTVDEQESRLSGAVEALVRRVDEHVSASEGGVFARVNECVERARKTVEEQEQRLSGAAEGYVRRVDEHVSASEGGVLARVKESSERARKTVEEQEQRLSGSVDGMVRRVDGYVSTAESGVLGRVEKRFAEYETEVGYRFKKLTDVNTDIEAMEQNLRKLLGSVEARIREELGAHAKSLEDERRVERERAEAEIAAFWAKHRELESGLADLKSKAYQNVSEKLKGFEDEFLADLRKRGDDMQAQIAELENGIEGRLQSIARDASEERQQAEARFAAELAAALEDLNRRVTESSSRVEADVGEFEAHTRSRVAAAEDTIRGFGEGLKGEIEGARADALGLFRRQAEELKSAVNADVEKSSREMAQTLARQRAEMESSRKELVDLLEATRADVIVSQARTQQLVNERETEAVEHAQAMKAELDGMLESLRDEFSAQRDDLVVGTNEERLKLRNELEEISGGIRELHDELTKRSDAALLTFRKELESFEIEYRKKSNDFGADMEKRFRGFKALLDGVREKSDAMQLKLFGKIEEGYNQLSVSLDDVDKRLKGFTAQTKIFERADNLRIVLEGNIDTLKGEIANLQAQRKEIHDLETQLLQTRRLADEVSQKLSKFTADRRRIEEMDGDFRRLLSLSRDIDVKLQSVTTSHDALQEIQARIRSLEELEESVETRFDRLEKKKAIIDTTSNGVQKNFQSLEALESNLEAVRPQIESVAGELSSLREQIDFLTTNKDKTDQVVSRLGDIDGILGSLEERIGKLQTAREWLARTETRLEEIGKQAQDQVRLLETLVKSELPKGRKEEGAPARDKRDTVVKLSRQGWSASEIARVTHLSRGEVELILELAPKTAG